MYKQTSISSFRNSRSILKLESQRLATRKQTSISSFRNLRSILKLKSQRLTLRVFVLDELDRKCHIDRSKKQNQVSKTQFWYLKKNRPEEEPTIWRRKTEEWSNDEERNDLTMKNWGTIWQWRTTTKNRGITNLSGWLDDPNDLTMKNWVTIWWRRIETKNRGRTDLSGRLDDLTLILKNSKDREEEEVKSESLKLNY